MKLDNLPQNICTNCKKIILEFDRLYYCCIDINAKFTQILVDRSSTHQCASSTNVQFANNQKVSSCFIYIRSYHVVFVMRFADFQRTDSKIPTAKIRTAKMPFFLKTKLLYDQ